MENPEIAYTLTRETTRRQTGFFVVLPDDDLTTESALARLKSRPMDEFLHQYVLTRISKMPPDAVQSLLNRGTTADDPVIRALAAEHLLLTKGREELQKRFSLNTIRDLSRHTPLVYLRSFLEPDQPLHSQWTAFFRANLHQHTPLSPPGRNGLPPLAVEFTSSRPAVTLADLTASASGDRASTPTEVSPARTADIAAERLTGAGVELGQLMRHESSLSPIGLLRTWRFVTRVSNGRNRFNLSGEQTSYGRGLSLDAARASLMMEIVERCSAFASVSARGLEKYQHDYPLRRASFSELIRENTGSTDPDSAGAVNPAALSLEAAYRDQPLYWVRGETPGLNQNGNFTRPIWIPVQCLFLFCNLDEPALFSGLGSTGLAAGNTPAQAKVAALLEIIERHQAATVPYDPATCFRLVARDARITPLLEAWRRAGIDLWFQDMTPASGIPCCRSFVVERTGQIHTGSAAHPDARRAILSAITENTCPFPNPPPTQPAPPDLTLVGYENLPDYSSKDAVTDLAILETLLIRNNYRPCYADLTRADIGLPVVKAMVPGMELLGDLDDYSRVHPDLYNNYLALFKHR